MCDNMKDHCLENNKVILKNNEKNTKRKWYQTPFNKKIDEIYLYNYKSLKGMSSKLCN